MDKNPLHVVIDITTAVRESWKKDVKKIINCVIFLNGQLFGNWGLSWNKYFFFAYLRCPVVMILWQCLMYVFRIATRESQSYLLFLWHRKHLTWFWDEYYSLSLWNSQTGPTDGYILWLGFKDVWLHICSAHHYQFHHNKSVHRLIQHLLTEGERSMAVLCLRFIRIKRSAAGTKSQSYCD